MGGHREKARLGTVGGVRLIARLGQRAFSLGALGHVAAYALHLRRPARIWSNQAFAPCDPSRSERTCNLLVVDSRAIGMKHGVTLLEHFERRAAADQHAARLLSELAISVVDEGDTALGVAQHDQVALRFKQAAGALLGFLQFPIAVGKRFVVERDLAKPMSHPAQPKAQGGERDASNREQEARPDRKRVRVITGTVGSASGNESVGAAECGGEDHERADRKNEPRVTSREAA